MNVIAAVLIQWMMLSEAGVRTKCYELTGRYAEACMELRDNVCTIYSPKIQHERDDRNFVKLGEETAHCFLGDFHKH